MPRRLLLIAPILFTVAATAGEKGKLFVATPLTADKSFTV
jgi:hypothetical protein